MATLLAVLIAYLAYVIASPAANKAMGAYITGISMLATGIPLLGISNKSPRLNVNLRVLSSVAMVFMLIENFIFIIAAIKISYYIIFTGLALIIFMISYYRLSRIKDI